MKTSHFADREDGRIELRAIVRKIDRELADLPRPATPALEELRADWAELIERLALGPAPELRACPSCGRIGMRGATRCGYCWMKLVPPATASA